MEPRRDDLDLTAELRALRPLPRPDFTAQLDARAEAGFSRRGTGPSSALSRAVDRLRATSPRRVLAPAGAFALIAIVIATAIVTTSDSRQDISMTSHEPGRAKTLEPFSRDLGHSATVVPSTSAEVEAAAPQSSDAGGEGPYASGTRRREIERSSQIVLGSEPADLRGDAAEVFEAVHAANGIVLSSSIRDGAAGEARASFDLLIPSGKLGDALASFSAIADVRSRHESTQDITAPTVGVGEKLRDSRARIESLLRELAATEAEAERTAVEAELRSERNRAASLRSRLSELNRRANLSHVTLRIETGESSAAGESGGAWGVDDGLDDAGRILATAAGITVIALAVLLPLALVCLLAWLVHRAWLRRARHRAVA